MRYIRFWRSQPTETSIIYNESLSLSVDDYLIDSDRSTLSFGPEVLYGRLSTGYPMEAYL
jgi:hypothetical protein